MLLGKDIVYKQIRGWTFIDFLEEKRANCSTDGEQQALPIGLFSELFTSCAQEQKCSNDDTIVYMEVSP